MNDLTTPNPITAPVINDQYSPMQIALDDKLFNQCYRLAQLMASGACTVPKHLQTVRNQDGSIKEDRTGDCFAIVGQALRWGFDPYAVAQKTHLVNGTLGYEAQLIIAVINSKAPITGRLKFEYYGDWTKVKTKDDKSDDVGVKVSATMRGDDEPTVLDLSMAQVGTVRNSPLWTADPRQQLAYLAAKRWARLYCPDVVLGLYSEDELQDRNAQPKDVTPTPTKNGGTASIKDRIKAKKAEPVMEAQGAECFNIDPKVKEIQSATTLDELMGLGKDIAQIKATENLCGDDLSILQNTWAEQRASIIYNELLNDINQSTSDDAQEMRQRIYGAKDKLGDERVQELNEILETVINQVTE